MDTLAKVGIQLLFPAYLFFIMLVIIILAKYSSKISNAGFSAAKTFSTLLLLCYTSVGETCILIITRKLKRFLSKSKGCRVVKSTTGQQCKLTRNKHGMVTRLPC